MPDLTKNIKLSLIGNNKDFEIVNTVLSKVEQQFDQVRNRRKEGSSSGNISDTEVPGFLWNDVPIPTEQNGIRLQKFGSKQLKKNRNIDMVELQVYQL